MAIAKVFVFGLLFVAALARPQLNDDEEAFDPNPKYAYSYQVSDDNEQTYIAHKEDRDGEEVTGEYSYVDPLGSLITVRYTSGAMGYTETRDVQDNFVSIRARPASSFSSSSSSSASSGFASSGASQSSGAIRQVVQTVQPVVQNVVRQETVSSNGDSDLVARIISQLTPYIQDTVSSSLGGSGASRSSTTTTTSTSSQALPLSVVSTAPVAVRTVVAQPIAQPIAVAAPTRQASSSVEGIFGVQGQNNVRVETPNFNFAYDLA